MAKSETSIEDFSCSTNNQCGVRYLSELEVYKVGTKHILAKIKPLCHNLSLTSFDFNDITLSLFHVFFFFFCDLVEMLSSIKYFWCYCLILASVCIIFCILFIYSVIYLLNNTRQYVTEYCRYVTSETFIWWKALAKLIKIIQLAERSFCYWRTNSKLTL